MNIKNMRNVHLYLGVFFTPLLLFFTLTGVLQTFGLHEPHKDGFKPLPIVESMAEVHKDQRLVHDHSSKSSMPFRYLVVLMTVGLIVTAVLGVVMAFKYTKPWMVWACLAAGILIPCIFILGNR